MWNRRQKDKKQLVAQTRVTHTDKVHYFDVYLWANKRALLENSLIDGDAEACCCTAPIYLKIHNNPAAIHEEWLYPKLGEAHFVKNDWDLETVAHEIMHATIHSMRWVKPRYDEVAWQHGNSEEAICYLHGRWVDKIYRWLWDTNPSKNWKRTRGKE
jgi:hypothetical protein